MSMRFLATSLLVLSIFCLTPGFSLAEEGSPAKTVFHLGEKPADLPFSPAVLVKDTLFISGLLATHPETGQFQGGTMTQQAERAIANMEVLLKKAGMGLSNVVQTNVYITDFNEFAEFNAVFRKMFPKAPPARATVQVSKLAMDAKIEISAIAVK